MASGPPPIPVHFEVDGLLIMYCTAVKPMEGPVNGKGKELNMNKLLAKFFAQTHKI